MTLPPSVFAEPVSFMARLLGGVEPVLSAPPPRVSRHYGLELLEGETELLPRATGRLVVHCREGEVWITHDGDPKDVILAAGQSYAAPSGRRLSVHAMQGACAIGIQIDPLQ